MKYCFGDDAEFVAVKHYERLQRELTEAQDKIEELVETGLTQMDKERSLKRELAEAREQISTLMHQQTIAMQELQEKWHSALKQRDTLAAAIEFSLSRSLACGESESRLRSALASVKGDSHE